ncbi:MAG: fimbrial protein [Tannerellaceae bacterium]|nr:fimbrial protein [Tannerellaceae bacterium]
MKLLKLFFLLFIVSLAGVSCSKDEPVAGNENGTGEIVTATFVLSESSPVRSGVQSTDQGEVYERTIKTLEFYIFDKEGNRDTDEYNYKQITIQEGQKQYEHNFPVTAGEKYFLVAVNMELGILKNVTTINELKKHLSNVELDNTNSQQTDGNGRVYFPMSGESGLVEITPNNSQKITLAIERLFSKIEAPRKAATVKMNLSDTNLKNLFGDGVTNEDVSFHLEAYCVINGINKSYVFRTNNEWLLPDEAGVEYFTTDIENNSVYSGTVGEGANETIWLKPAATETSATETPVYVYENYPVAKQQNGMEMFEAKTLYAMVLKGTLSAKDKTTSTRYWRMNLNTKGGYKIDRNAKYIFTITQLNSIGSENEEDNDGDGGGLVPGEGAAAVEVTLDVQPWNVLGIEEEI